jgi:HAD superfamily hydrolase (TIGR01509 family)
MSSPQAVIFDLDGVIVNSEPHHERAFHEVLRRLDFKGPLGLEFASYLGRSDYELWVDFVARHKPRQTAAELIALKRQIVLESLGAAQPFFPGVIELIEKLAARSRLAVASGAEHLVIETMLALRNLRRFFPVVVSSADVKQGKPAPDIFLRAAKLLDVPPKDCWVIEDSKPGVAAALAAGMQVIAIANTHPAEELVHASRVVRTYPEIGRLLGLAA